MGSVGLNIYVYTRRNYGYQYPSWNEKDPKANSCEIDSRFYRRSNDLVRLFSLHQSFSFDSRITGEFN